MGDFPFGGVPALQLQAATPVAGVALVNGTPTILSWTAPNDGKLHRFELFGGESVSVTQVGGLINTTFTAPDGSAQTIGLFGPSLAVGYWLISNYYQGISLIQPGSTVSIVQATAQTSGTAKVYCEIWGS
jgi:hypothetical protein